MRLLVASLGIALAALCLAGTPARAAPLDATVLAGLAAEDSEARIAAIRALATAATPEAAAILQALSEDRLQAAGERILVTQGDKVLDAATGDVLAAAPDGAEAITINNRVRRALEGSLAVLRIFDPDARTRQAAALELSRRVTPDNLPMLERALATEKDGEVRELLTLAHAKGSLQSPDPAARLAAVKELG
jgi:urea transport system permease protein